MPDSQDHREHEQSCHEQHVEERDEAAMNSEPHAQHEADQDRVKKNGKDVQDTATKKKDFGQNFTKTAVADTTTPSGQQEMREQHPRATRCWCA